MSIEEDQIYKNFGKRGEISQINFDIRPVPIVLATGYGNGVDFVVLKSGEIAIATTSTDGGIFQVKVFTDQTVEKLKDLLSRI